MTVLTITQKKNLNAVVEGKRLYDEREANLQAEIAKVREGYKRELHELVQVCVDDNVPMRQIHMVGMGMGQANQMTKFFTPSKGNSREAFSSLGAALGLSAGSTQVKIALEVETSMELKGGKAYWTRRDGTKRVEPFFSQEYGVIYLMAEVTDEDKDIIDSLNSNRVLFGDAEIEAFEEGTKPARWDGKNIPERAPDILKYPKN